MKYKYSMTEVIDIFELDPRQLPKLDRRMSFSQACRALEELKQRFRSQRKLLAKKYHPDRTGGDGEQLKLINHLLDQVEKLDIVKPRPQPKVVYYWSRSAYGGGTNSTNYTYYTNYG